jgi:hypothetical protein
MATMCTIGYTGAGKSHFLGLMYLYLNKLARENPDVKVYADVKSDELDIPALADSISRGIPLLPTGAGQINQAALNIEFPRIFGKKTARIPVLDMSGELIIAAMEVLDIGKGHIGFKDLEEQLVQNLGMDLDSIAKMHQDIFRADAYAFLFNLDLEMSTQEQGGNVKYRTFLQNLMEYREHNGIGPPKGVALIFSRLESVKSQLLAEWQGEITPEKMTGYFAPFISTESLARTGQEPRSFLTYTEWDKAPDTDDDLPEGRFRVVTDDKTFQRLPVYPEDTYRDILGWMRGL